MNQPDAYTPGFCSRFTLVLEESIQNLAAARIERKTVANQELNAVAIRNQQGWRGEPADVLLTFEDKRCFAPIRFHLPGTRRDKTRYIVNMPDFGNELAAGQIGFD